MTSNQARSLEELIAAMPFAASLGIELDAAARGEVRGRLMWDTSRCTVGGVMHGGALMSFADSLGAICAFLNLPEGAGTATIESKTNLFRAVRSGVVRGVCRPLHVGRSTIVVQTDLSDDGDRRVAQVTQTQSILRPEI
jgi:1,4-dihydroxy-2-naphthoyl-CoA hydrolase